MFRQHFAFFLHCKKNSKSSFINALSTPTCLQFNSDVTFEQTQFEQKFSILKFLLKSISLHSVFGHVERPGNETRCDCSYTTKRELQSRGC